MERPNTTLDPEKFLQAELGINLAKQMIFRSRMKRILHEYQVVVLLLIFLQIFTEAIVSDSSLISLAVENIGDVDYRVHGSGLNGAGRNFILSCSLMFRAVFIWDRPP